MKFTKSAHRKTKIKISKKCKSCQKYISSVSLKLSVCEVAVLMCTRNLQSMSSKLLLQVDDPEIWFLR